MVGLTCHFTSDNTLEYSNLELVDSRLSLYPYPIRHGLSKVPPKPPLITQNASGSNEGWLGQAPR
jgi:hypothetical protein